jgi:hypothetical protein
MREVALRTSYIEGMQGYEGLLCMYSPALPLDPVPADAIFRRMGVPIFDVSADGHAKEM